MPVSGMKAFERTCKSCGNSDTITVRTYLPGEIVAKLPGQVRRKCPVCKGQMRVKYNPHIIF